MNSVWEEPTWCLQENLKYGQTIKYSATEIHSLLFLMFLLNFYGSIDQKHKENRGRKDVERLKVLIKEYFHILNSSNTQGGIII